MEQSFWAFIDSLEFDEDGVLSVFKYTKLDNSAEIVLLSKCEGQDRYWKIPVEYIVESYIEQEWAHYCDTSQEDIRLLQYTEVAYSLYFNNTGSSANNLARKIYDLHINEFDRLLPIEKYIHGNLFETCSQKYGLFARGPETIISHYKNLLEQEDIDCSLVIHGRKKLWSDNKQGEKFEDLEIFCVGDSYFIGRDFDFETFGMRKI